MHVHHTGWMTATVLLVLAAFHLALPPRDRAAQDETHPRDDVVKMADMIARKDLAGAKKHANTLPADLDPEEVMSVFSLRTGKGKGGLGIGPKPGAITPDGIEKKLQDLAQGKPLTKAAMVRQAKALERAGYIAAAVALAVQDRPPVRGKKDRKDWQTWAGEMHQAAREFATAATTNDPKQVTRAAVKLNDSCIRCHKVFKDGGGPPQTLPDLIADLKDKNPIIRSSAARTLGATYGPQAKAVVPHLLETMDDRDKEVRRNAASSLAALGVTAQTAIPVVNTALRDADQDVRFWFACKLKGVRPESKKLIPVLVEALKHPDDDLRCKAFQVLARLGPESKTAVPTLVERLRDSSADVRRSAAAALTRIGAEAAIPALIRSLKDKDPIIRGRAGVALAHMGKAAVPALRQALKGDDRAARAAAVYALGRIGPDAKTAVPALLDMLNDKDEYLRTVAAIALKKIDPEAAAKVGRK